MYFTVKVLISAIIIATVTKLSEKVPVGGALLKSLPLTSLLVFFFMKFEGRSNKEISTMSWDVLFLVIPSLVLFIILPMLLDRGWSFAVSMSVSTIVMCFAYGITLKIMA
jgi:hypothetical protein